MKQYWEKIKISKDKFRDIDAEIGTFEDSRMQE
jgi:hypothetical protein